MATATTTYPPQQQQPPFDAAPGPIYVDTQHEDLVHDAQMDYYGSKLATCSSDRTVKIYNVSETSYELSATLQGHDGAVWQVSWAHPKFGVILASCSFDGSVLIRREQRPGDWIVLHAATGLHNSSINGVAFAPHEFGLQLAAASSDGRVSVLQHLPNQTWSVEYISDCPTGVNAVSWAPYGAYYEMTTDSSDPSSLGGGGRLEAPHLATAGCDNIVRFYVYNYDQGQWVSDGSTANAPLGHTDWVRDVAWAPCLLPNINIVASCSEDRTVILWKQERVVNASDKENDGETTNDGSEATTAEWKPTLLHTFEDPVWRVSWSITGQLLAVSSGDSTVTLWKAGLDGKWSQVETTFEDEVNATAQQ